MFIFRMNDNVTTHEATKQTQGSMEHEATLGKEVQLSCMEKHIQEALVDHMKQLQNILAHKTKHKPTIAVAWSQHGKRQTPYKRNSTEACNIHTCMDWLNIEKACREHLQCSFGHGSRQTCSTDTCRTCKCPAALDCAVCIHENECTLCRNMLNGDKVESYKPGYLLTESVAILEQPEQQEETYKLRTRSVYRSILPTVAKPTDACTNTYMEEQKARDEAHGIEQYRKQRRPNILKPSIEIKPKKKFDAKKHI